MDTSVSDLFQRSFLSCRRLSSLPWTELEKALKSDNSVMLDILKKTILHPLCRKHPPSLQYRRLFLSELIKKHERAGAEPLDELYEALAEVLNSEESPVCHKSYLLPSGDFVTLAENTAIISGGTTGLVTWEAALSLAEWAIENASVFTNRTILELGSGAGLTGLAVCKSCHPKKYVFSDCHQRVLQQLRGNIHLNGYVLEEEHSHPVTGAHGEVTQGKTQVSVIELNCDTVTEEQLADLQAEVVIASDVVYDPMIIVPFSRVLKKLSSCLKDGRNLDMFIASTVRNPETYSLFHAALDEAGLRRQVLPGHQTFFPCDTNCAVEILSISQKEQHFTEPEKQQFT